MLSLFPYSGVSSCFPNFSLTYAIIVPPQWSFLLFFHFFVHLHFVSYNIDNVLMFGVLWSLLNEQVRHMFDEIDYIREAKNADRFASLYASRPSKFS